MTCADCGKDTSQDLRDYYMVTFKLWKKHGVGKRMLCMDCFEKRLGRKLKAEDILDCPVNTMWNPYTKEILGII